MSFLLLPLLAQGVLSAGTGQWGSTINFPLVPVAGAIVPNTGQLLVWSAYANNTFGINYENVTQTAVWNPVNGSVQEFPIAYTQHDMFCPGISFDFTGRLVVTGGDTSPATSLLSAGTWQTGPDMVLGRGYQSSVTLSDGRIFVIGGSWSGARGGKNGEVFNGTEWTYMPGCAVAPMLTNDPQGIFRQDNHGWLFAWSNGTVFQAGPSIAMNWYYPTENGSYKGAGQRTGAQDAMCGPAVMYDAGKILAVGGSPAYQDEEATADAFLITIPSPGQTAPVKQISNMYSKRIFATSTVLPDGTVFIVGGQSYGVPFSDANSSMVPELWSPVTQQFTQMAQQPEARNYHSMAVLMPDGTVFSGGGGLCGNCGSSNHFTGQIYTPPYLFASDGKTPATRPIISNVSATTIIVGGTFNVTLGSSSGTIAFSIVRYGSSTHTVNTDQRRLPLTPRSNLGSTYTLQLPSDPGVVLPGYWFLFAMQNGVPSLSQTILIQPAS